MNPLWLQGSERSLCDERLGGSEKDCLMSLTPAKERRRARGQKLVRVFDK